MKCINAGTDSQIYTQSLDYIVIKQSHQYSHDRYLSWQALRSNYLPVLAISLLDIIVFLPKLPTHFLMPHSLACLPTGAAPTATVASAAGGIVGAFLFNLLFLWLLILRFHQENVTRFKVADTKVPLGTERTKVDKEKSSWNQSSLANYLGNFWALRSPKKGNKRGREETIQKEDIRVTNLDVKTLATQHLLERVRNRVWGTLIFCVTESFEQSTNSHIMWPPFPVFGALLKTWPLSMSLQQSLLKTMPFMNSHCT